MADRPIIFSAPMVQALLAGRKTQTRRVLKPQPFAEVAGFQRVFCEPPFYEAVDAAGKPVVQAFPYPKGFVSPYPRLPCAPGDRLWAREAHALVPASAYRMSEGVAQAVNPEDRDRAAIYREGFDRSQGGIRWRPSIHMPRWASRLTLHVSEVRVQRLQEISEEDAVAEGIAPLFTDAEKEAYPECRGDSWRNYLWHGRHDARPSWIDAWEHQYSGYKDARGSFSSLWASIHGPDAWASNPWVCGITFSVERANIDEARHA